jgi:hypothetical protein
MYIYIYIYTVEPLLFGLRLTVSLTGMQFLSTFSARVELLAVSRRISTPEKKMASDLVNKRKRVVLNNVFWRTFSRKIPERRKYDKRLKQLPVFLFKTNNVL